MQEYEIKIADLESETDRLSEALEAQKSATEAAQAAAAKKVEELGREVQKKAAEVDQLKAKLRQYSDYDEIKRELEIMKASSIPSESGRAGLKVSSAGSRVRWYGGRRRRRR